MTSDIDTRCGLDRYMAAFCDRSLAPNSPRCFDPESRLRRNNRFWTRERRQRLARDIAVAPARIISWVVFDALRFDGEVLLAELLDLLRSDPVRSVVVGIRSR